MAADLAEVVALSNRFGADAMFVRAGGGNSSVKADGVVYIKPSIEGLLALALVVGGLVVDQAKRDHGLCERAVISLELRAVAAAATVDAPATSAAACSAGGAGCNRILSEDRNEEVWAMLYPRQKEVT